MTHSHTSLDRFGTLIDLYGADFARWPIADRAWGEAFARSSMEAAKLLAEERALDNVLSFAAKPSGEQITRLSEAIMAEVGRTATPAGEPSSSRNVILFEPAKRTLSKLGSAPATYRPTSPARRWQAGAGLAASLVLGLLIGTFDLTALSYLPMIDGSGSEQDVVQFVSSLSGDGLTPSLDEDYL